MICVFASECEMLGRLLGNGDEDKPAFLEEDEPAFSGIVGGKLTFKEGENPESQQPQSSSTSDKLRSWLNVNKSAMSQNSPRRATQQRVTFEIVSAKTITDTKKKYVSYTVLIKRVPGLETQPGVLERRYTDFANLFHILKKRHPSALSDFPFPKKSLMGNFTADIITERSVAFQHFLAYSYSIRDLRQSPELAEFLYNRELQEAHAMMKAGQFEDSSVILENIYFVQEKILDGEHFSTYYTLCVLVACLNAVDNVVEAQKYAELGVELSVPHEKHELTLPLLILCIRLWWSVGKDKKFLERRLQEMKQSGANTDKQPTLLELVLHGHCPMKP